MSQALAKNGSVYLMEYECGLYAADKITKSCGYSLKTSDNKQEVVDFFSNYIKGVRRSKTDFNLEIYGN